MIYLQRQKSINDNDLFATIKLRHQINIICDDSKKSLINYLVRRSNKVANNVFLQRFFGVVNNLQLFTFDYLQRNKSATNNIF